MPFTFACVNGWNQNYRLHAEKPRGARLIQTVPYRSPDGRELTVLLRWH